MSPVNSQVVFLASIPEVPSKTCENLKFQLDVSKSYNTKSPHLNDSFGALDFEDLTSAIGSIWKLKVDNFSEFGELDSVQNDQRTIDTRDCAVCDPGLSNVVPCQGSNLVVDSLTNAYRRHLETKRSFARVSNVTC